MQAVNQRNPFIVWGIVVFVVILAILAIMSPTTAQTSEPTPEPTLDAINDTPGDAPDLVDPTPYEQAIERLTAIIMFLLGIGGVTGIIALLKLSPGTAKVAANVGMDVLEMLARITKSPHDDSALQKIRAELNARIDQILLNMTPPAAVQSLQPVVLQTLPGVPATVAGTQLSVNEQVALIESQLALLRDYMTDTSPKDVVGGPSEDPDFPVS